MWGLSVKMLLGVLVVGDVSEVMVGQIGQRAVGGGWCVRKWLST